MTVRMDELRHDWGATEHGRRTTSAILDHLSTLPRRPQPWPPPNRITPNGILANGIAALGEPARDGLTLLDFGLSVLPGWRADADHWRSTCSVAGVADAICTLAEREQNRGTVMASALLGGVGRFVLHDAMPKAYARVEHVAYTECLPLHAVERMILGIDHADTARLVLQHWSVAAEIAETVGLRHQQPALLLGSSPHAPTAAVLQLADILIGGRPSRRAAIPLLCDIISLEPHQLSGLPGSAHDARDHLEAIIARMRHGDASGIDAAGVVGGDGQDPTWVGPLLRLSAATVHNAGVSAVVRRVLEDLLAVTAVARGVVFAVDHSADTITCASVVDGEMLDERFALDQALPAGDVPDSYLGGPLMYAPPMSSPVRDRTRGRFGRRLPLMLPLRSGDAVVGGVLLDEAGARALTSAMSLDAMRLFAAVAGASVDAALRASADVHRFSAASAMHASAIDNRASAERDRTNAMVAEMAAGAAHEMNNPLSVISGRVQILARSESDPATLQTLELIREQCDEASNIVSDLVSVAKPEPPRPVLSGLETVFSQVRAHWDDRVVGAGGRLVIMPAKADVRVWCDAMQLTRVIDELLENAVQWLRRENGVVQINSPSSPSDDTVVIMIKDNGSGMSEDVLSRAFDPFYSHQLAGRRRGLGLSLARRLAEINGGSLYVESTVDVGTTAFVELPARA